MAPSAIESTTSNGDVFVDTDELRNTFALAMSAMYKKEVPLYGDLIRIVRNVNNETLASSSDPRVVSINNGDVAAERLDLERHGAIRLGTPYELHTVRKIFQVIGLYPIGYYDLSQAELPMHATCFRPTSTNALKKNPFRVFTTLLRPDLLNDQEAKKLALELLERRNIFSSGLMDTLEVADKQNGRLTGPQANVFVREAMKTFGWRPVAAATAEEYQKLKEEHPILADIACFQTSHINHLTPRTLNIAAAQERMKSEGMEVKSRIEGPPVRNCPVLLRQTSFLALEERILFPGAGESLANGSHKARFGEIEERGAAVTPLGRELYDSLLSQSMKTIADKAVSNNPKKADEILLETFKKFPDTWPELRQQGLVYFDFRCTTKAGAAVLPPNPTVEALVAQGFIEAIPITYEDFLPLSAAGIFQSNLQSTAKKTASAYIKEAFSDKTGYERALKRSVVDMDAWYAEAQQASLRTCALKLGIREDCLSRKCFFSGQYRISVSAFVASTCPGDRKSSHLCSRKFD